MTWQHVVSWRLLAFAIESQHVVEDASNIIWSSAPPGGRFSHTFFRYLSTKFSNHEKHHILVVFVNLQIFFEWDSPAQSSLYHTELLQIVFPYKKSCGIPLGFFVRVVPSRIDPFQCPTKNLLYQTALISSTSTVCNVLWEVTTKEPIHSGSVCLFLSFYSQMCWNQSVNTTNHSPTCRQKEQC